MRARARVLSVVFLSLGGAGLGLSGCLERELTPLTPCTQSGVVEQIRVTSVDKVDLLFMVDNSNSMTEEQNSLAMQFPRLMRVLASGDRNGDGITEFPPVQSLQVGVISSDMGTGGNRVTTCNEPNFGDDGRLRTAGNTAIPGCVATYPTFLSFRPGDNVDAFASSVSCVAVLGVGGCGFEQQLEAVLKAITPSTQPPVNAAFDGTFWSGTRGHADGVNAGFVRPDSVLALVVVTDEEDCSALDPDLFNPSSGRYMGDLNLRCFQYPAAVHPVDRFVGGYLAQRTTPDLLVYAAITGVPPDLVPAPDAIPNYDAILADPRMQERVDTGSATPRLVPSCDVPGRGIAFPPRRIVEVAKRLDQAGAGGVVQSICQADFTPALDAIIEKIADVLGGACLPRELNPDETGAVACNVIETLPTRGDYTRCDQVAGREFIGTDPGTGGEICRVQQTPAVGRVPPAGPGWYYDNFSADVLSRCGSTPTDGQRISFTSGHTPVTGTLVRLECLQPVQGSQGPSTLDIDVPCDPSGPACTRGAAVGDRTCLRNMTCEPTTRTWKVVCNSDADCSNADLAGFRCDLARPLGGAAGTCTNPTC